MQFIIWFYRITSNLQPRNTNAIMYVGVWLLFGVHLSVTALRVIMATHTRFEYKLIQTEGKPTAATE